MHKIYTQNNYFYHINPDGVITGGLKSSFEFQPSGDNFDLIYKGSFKLAENIPFDDFADEGGTPYGTLEDFENFYTSNTGFSFATSESVADLEQNLSEHEADLNNPHVVTKTQIGLGNADNTSDINKPISNATQSALDLKINIDANASGELSGTFGNLAVLNSAVLAKVLTGLNVAGASLSDTDTIIQAFGKIQNQINMVLGGAIYQSVWNPTTNTPALSDATGTKGYYYVSTTNAVRNLGSGNIDFKIGDWAIHNGTIYEKVDNTDAVTSVNGYIGAVNLTSADISEVTNLYFTTARVLATQLSGYVSGAGTVAATDTILQAIQKLNGNIVAGLASKQDTLTDVSFGAFVSTFTAKVTPIDADTINLVDSADSNKAKKVTWVNIKATLLTYFNTIYQVILVSGTNIKTINGNSLLGAGDLAVLPVVTEAVGTSLAQTSSGSAVLLTDMTVTPGAGTYLAIFSCYGEPSGSLGATITLALYVNGVIVAGTTRVLENNSLIASTAQNGSLSINKKITPTAGQAVEIKWSSSGGTASISHRTLDLIAVA